MWRWLVLACGFIVAGCYEPHFAECKVRCSSTRDCAPSLICGSDGWCALPSRLAGCSGSSGPDGSRPEDASPACAPGCSGTCNAGVCVIECSGPQQCELPVACPQDGPCDVACVGRQSCRGGVVCGAGPCVVTCEGKDSCEAGVMCDSACSCDVSCEGDGACKKHATCSSTTCTAGRGCTSALPGCSRC
jgi:hypothetical protein